MMDALALLYTRERGDPRAWSPPAAYLKALVTRFTSASRGAGVPVDAAEFHAAVDLHWAVTRRLATHVCLAATGLWSFPPSKAPVTHMCGAPIVMNSSSTRRRT